MANAITSLHRQLQQHQFAMQMQANDGEIEWQTYLEPEVDEGYSGVAVWGSMPPVDPIRHQASFLMHYRVQEHTFPLTPPLLHGTVRLPICCNLWYLQQQ